MYFFVLVATEKGYLLGYKQASIQPLGIPRFNGFNFKMMIKDHLINELIEKFKRKITTPGKKRIIFWGFKNFNDSTLDNTIATIIGKELKPLLYSRGLLANEFLEITKIQGSEITKLLIQSKLNDNSSIEIYNIKQCPYDSNLRIEYEKTARLVDESGEVDFPSQDGGTRNESESGPPKETDQTPSLEEPALPLSSVTSNKNDEKEQKENNDSIPQVNSSKLKSSRSQADHLSKPSASEMHYKKLNSAACPEQQINRELNSLQNPSISPANSTLNLKEATAEGITTTGTGIITEQSTSTREIQVTKDFTADLKALQNFYELIRQRNDFDSPVMKAMKSQIGVKGIGLFKPSDIDGVEELFARLTVNEGKTADGKATQAGIKLRVKTHDHRNTDAEFVFYRTIPYYPGEADIPQLSRLNGSLYLTTSPESAVIHEYRNAQEHNPEEKKREKAFVKKSIEYVAKKANKNKVIYLVNGATLKEREQIYYSNAETYQSLGWKASRDNPKYGEPGLHFFKLSPDKTQTNIDTEIIYLPTVDHDLRYSLQIREQDLANLYNLVKRVKNGEPLITHCKEGYDRAARIAFAFDLFLNFDEIIKEAESQSVQAIIQRYLNLRRKRAPGALSEIKQFKDALYLAYAFKAMAIYESALQQLQEKYSAKKKEFFENFATCQSTDSKIKFVESAVNDVQVEEERKDFILFEKILRERRLAERVCLWEVNPQLFLNFPDPPEGDVDQKIWRAEVEDIIATKKRDYFQSMLLDDHIVEQKRIPSLLPFRQALLETGILYKSDKDILNIKKVKTIEIHSRAKITNTNSTGINSAEDEIKKEEKGTEKEGADSSPSPANVQTPAPTDFIKKVTEKKKGQTLNPTALKELNKEKDLLKSTTSNFVTQGTGVNSIPSDSLFTPENVISKKSQDEILRTAAQHRPEADKYAALAKKMDETDFIETMRKKFEEKLKPFDKQQKRMEGLLARYIYNRIYRNKTLAILSCDFFASPIIFDKPGALSELVNHALWRYANPPDPTTNQVLISFPGKKSNELDIKIGNLDTSTQAKVNDALNLLGKLINIYYTSKSELLDTVMARVLNEIQLNDFSDDQMQTKLENKANVLLMDIKKMMSETISETIHEHRQTNNQLESEKIINKRIHQFFPCASRLSKDGYKWTLNQSHYEWILKDAADELNKLAPPSSPSL